MMKEVDVSTPVAALTAPPVTELMVRHLGARKAHVKVGAVFAVQQFFHDAGCPKGCALATL